MSEATEGGSVAIHCISLAVIFIRESGDIIKQDRGVQRRLGFKIPKDHQRFIPTAGVDYEILERMPESGDQLVFAIGDHQDNVRSHAVGDMTPVDTIQTQHGVIIVFNAVACTGHCLSECGFNPGSAKFSAFDGGIEADNTELICVRVARIARFCFRNYFCLGQRGDMETALECRFSLRALGTSFSGELVLIISHD
jgi:hypothetical protein